MRWEEPNAKNMERCWQQLAARDGGTLLQQRAALRLARPKDKEAKAPWTNIFDSTFVVNLLSRPERREHVFKALPRGGRFELVNATEKASLDERVWAHRFVLPRKVNESRVLPDRRRDWRNDNEQWPPTASMLNAALRLGAADDALHPTAPVDGFASNEVVATSVGNRGMAGCYISHLRLLKRLAAAPELDAVLIVEDDLVLTSAFSTRLYTALASLPSLWDLLNIGWAPNYPPCNRTRGTDDRIASPCSRSAVGSEGRAPTICRVRGRLQNTAAYVVRRRALEWLIPLLEAPVLAVGRGSGEKMLPIDLTLSAHYARHPEVHVYATAEPIVLQIEHVFGSRMRCALHKKCASGIAMTSMHAHLRPLCPGSCKGPPLAT